ncbi:MAG: 4Fe-4S binding protein [Chloroflexota bacterium]
MAKSKKLVKNETDVTWKDLEVGSIVAEPGSASQYQTGSWRSQKPILNKSKCNKCGLCYIYCPEGCIAEEEDGYFVANMFYCKGCGICSAECPKKAIKMEPEEE